MKNGWGEASEVAKWTAGALAITSLSIPLSNVNLPIVAQGFAYEDQCLWSATSAQKITTHDCFLSLLQKYYKIQEMPQLSSFLDTKLDVVKFLAFAGTEFKKRFPTESAHLSLRSDGRLLICLDFKGDVEQKLQKLFEFEDKWWIDNSGSYDDIISINII